MYEMDVIISHEQYLLYTCHFIIGVKCKSVYQRSTQTSIDNRYYFWQLHLDNDEWKVNLIFSNFYLFIFKAG